MSNIANACVDSNDFQTDAGGRLQLNSQFVQSVLATFERELVSSAFVKVTELPDVVIPVSGVWVVSWDAHGEATNQPSTAGVLINSTAVAALAVNNVVQPNTETMMALNSRGSSPGIDLPSEQQHGSGSGTRVLVLTAGQTLSLFAKRVSSAGTTTQIISDDQGRCRITAHRIGAN